MPTVRLDAPRLTDWDSFHTVFASTFGFPDFYGRNINAWIDCMTSLDAPEDGLTTVHGTESDPVVLYMENMDKVPDEILKALIEDAAFINYRKLKVGEPAVLIMAFWRHQVG
jgi:RNAse (barnase) inhibitor barstar